VDKRPDIPAALSAIPPALSDPIAPNNVPDPGTRTLRSRSQAEISETNLPELPELPASPNKKRKRPTVPKEYLWNSEDITLRIHETLSFDEIALQSILDSNSMTAIDEMLEKVGAMEIPSERTLGNFGLDDAWKDLINAKIDIGLGKLALRIREAWFGFKVALYLKYGLLLL
jgi:hypothetical protein